MFVVLTRLSFYHSLSAFYQIISSFILHSINAILQQLTIILAIPKRKSVEYTFLYTFKMKHYAKCIDTSIIIICLFHIFLRLFITKSSFVIKVKKITIKTSSYHISSNQNFTYFLQISMLVQLILCLS